MTSDNAEPESTGRHDAAVASMTIPDVADRLWTEELIRLFEQFDTPSQARIIRRMRSVRERGAAGTARDDECAQRFLHRHAFVLAQEAARRPIGHGRPRSKGSAEQYLG
jgi:hypothetical protein